MKKIHTPKLTFFTLESKFTKALALATIAFLRDG